MHGIRSSHWQLSSTHPMFLRSCCMDYTTCYCRSSQCPLYGQIAPRACLKMHDWQRQGPRFRCERCGVVVSATTGTAYVGGREPFVQHFRWRVSDASLKRSSCSLSDKAGIAITVESIAESIGCAGCESLLSSGMSAFQR